MTDDIKLSIIINILKQYAEQKHCYDRKGDDYNPNSYTHGEDAFEDGAEYGEILFARTLLEQIGVEFQYPIMKEND